jgi:hypothetical protein
MFKIIMKMFMVIVFICVISVHVDAQISSNQIVGRWEYQSGDWIWFFGHSEVIEFRANGTAISYEEYEAGNWSISGQQLIIVYDDDEREYFRFSIRNNILTITDSDGDVGRWRRE